MRISGGLRLCWLGDVFFVVFRRGLARHSKNPCMAKGGVEDFLQHDSIW